MSPARVPRLYSRHLDDSALCFLPSIVFETSAGQGVANGANSVTPTDAERAAADISKVVRRQLARLEQAVKQRRRTFLGKRHANAFEENIGRLSQQGVNRMLTTIGAFYVRLPKHVQNDARPQYLQFVRTLKLLADDVFIETLGPVSQRSRRIESGRKARQRYMEALKGFAMASPFLFEGTPQFRKLGQTPYPLATSPTVLLFFPIRRELEISRQDRYDYLIDYAFNKATRALSKHLDKSPRAPLDERTLHLLGITFLLHQMFLNDMSLHAPLTAKGPDWYEAVALDVKRLRDQILGRLPQLERAAIVERNSLSEAVWLNTLSTQLTDELTRVYSMRFEQTVDLWAPHVKQLQNHPIHSLARTIVGTKGATEVVRSYLGNPTPDRVRAADSLAVADVAGKKLAGTVAVYGRVARRGSRLADLVKPAHLRLRPSQTSLKDGSLVLARGTLDPAGTTLHVNDYGPLVAAYNSSVGFDMPRDAMAHTLDLTPPYRTVTEALLDESAIEQRQDNLAATISGQERLLADLAYLPSVRALFAGRGKLHKRLDMHDLRFRGEVWNSVYRDLHAADPDRALPALLDYLQRYLLYFTRHTLWNVRDSGLDYFRTRWPRSLSDQALHDCGVYCVLAAHDLYRATHGAKGAPRIHFGFVTFLNHIALFGCTDKLSFFINNDKIRTDLLDRPLRTRADRAEDALRRWAQFGFADVYRVDYSIAIVRVPYWTVATATSEQAFRRLLWSKYKWFATWWGLQPKIARKQHEQLKLYDAKMKTLAQTVRGSNLASAAPTSATMTSASRLSLELFSLADALVDKARYRARPGRIHHAKAAAVVAPPAPSPEPPLYQVVRSLRAAVARGKALSPQQQTLMAKPTSAKAHAEDLANKAF